MQLSWEYLPRGWRGEVVDGSGVHEIGANEPCECEDAGDRALDRMRHAQQQIGDQSCGYLCPDGVQRGAEEAADFEGLLDPAEEQLDLPARLVELGDLLRRRLQVVADEAQNLAGVDPDVDLAQRLLDGIVAATRETTGQADDAVGDDAAPASTLRSSTNVGLVCS
jgi:hypothetical protein